MKTFKTLATGLLAVAAVSIASAAPITIHLTGSTAFRKATYLAIVKSLATPTGASVGGTTSDMTGAGQAVIHGFVGTTSGQEVIFEVAFAGSVGGVHAASNALTVIPLNNYGTGKVFDAQGTDTWLNTANTLGALTVNVSKIAGAPVITSGAGHYDAPVAPDATMSDSFQSSTPDANSTALNDITISGANGCGIVDFHWVLQADPGSIPASEYSLITNMTPLQAQDLLTNGTVGLDQFTGVAADKAYLVALVGRNNDSGTRLAAEAESGYGFGQTEAQYAPTITANVETAVAAVGDVGYASGGSVASALDTPQQASPVLKISSKPFLFVGYLGSSDATAAETAVAPLSPAKELNYAGIPFSQNAIQQGYYTFWTYEHMYSVPAAGTIFNTLSTVEAELENTDAAFSGTLNSTMGTTSRSIEGGIVTQ